jgi:hypothetical protein
VAAPLPRPLFGSPGRGASQKSGVTPDKGPDAPGEVQSRVRLYRDGPCGRLEDPRWEVGYGAGNGPLEGALSPPSLGLATLSKFQCANAMAGCHGHLMH